jgi:DNA-binding transcriptional regulator PaaX
MTRMMEEVILQDATDFDYEHSNPVLIRGQEHLYLGDLRLYENKAASYLDKWNNLQIKVEELQRQQAKAREKLCMQYIRPGMLSSLSRQIIEDYLNQ